MPNNPIAKLKEGDSIKGFYFCKNIQNKITRLGDEYLDIILEDSTGNIRAKVWSYVDHYKDDIKNGSKVAVKGKIITYNNELEIDILHVNSIENGLYDKYGFSDDLIFKHSENELNEFFKNVQSFCQLLPREYKGKVLKVMKDYQSEIVKIPSLDIPYNYPGGYIKQLLSVLTVNSRLFKDYSYDYKKIIAGLIFKNIGLLKYFNIDDNFSITDKNLKKGYRILGVDLVDNYLNPKEEISHFIKNVIISDTCTDYEIGVINSLYACDLKLRNL
jgi:3'-5' exoribonuclease